MNEEKGIVGLTSGGAFAGMERPRRRLVASGHGRCSVAWMETWLRCTEASDVKEMCVSFMALVSKQVITELQLQFLSWSSAPS